MDQNVVDPFNRDVVAAGGYQYTAPDRLSSRHANRRFSDVILRSIPAAGKRLVDVGCGDGTYTAVLCAESGAAHVLGIDPAAAAIARAAEIYASRHQNLAFRICLAEDLVRQGEHFDVAVYRGVIHHTGDPQKEILLALQLADFVFILEPNGWNPILKILEKASRYHRCHQERSFTRGRLCRWIRSAGGSVVRATYFGLVPMFCPDWMCAVCSFFEPAVERIPLLRVVSCGQIGILASAAPRR